MRIILTTIIFKNFFGTDNIHQVKNLLLGIAADNQRYVGQSENKVVIETADDKKAAHDLINANNAKIKADAKHHPTIIGQMLNAFVKINDKGIDGKGSGRS